MSAKTCLLCGRPLGRVRPGAGSEFCSREHRNQYTLRRSMDCLTEANKVATLARRRENLKTLNSAPAGAAVPEPHGRAEALSFAGTIGTRPALRPAKLERTPAISMPKAGMLPAPGFRGAAVDRRVFGFQLTPAKRRGIAARRPPAALPGRVRLTAAPGVRPPRPKAQAGNGFSVPARVVFRPGTPLLRRAKSVRVPGSIGRATQGRILNLEPARGGSIPWICRVEIPRPKSWAPTVPGPAAVRFLWPGTAGIELRPATLDGSAPRAAALRPGAPHTPLLPAPGAAPASGRIGPSGVSRLVSLAAGAPARLAEQRLAFEELAFPGAPDAPARLKWVEAALQERSGSTRGGV